MLGRGVDQVLPHPSPPALYEPHVASALDYVHLAERAHGRIQKPASFASIWGDALEVLERLRPDLRIINLETAVTRSDRPWPEGINYRMNPRNIPCLTAASVDCCVLANNHVVDWGREGLLETLDALHRAGLKTAGAGRDAEEAAAPAILPVPKKGRVLVYALACPSSGVPGDWAAGPNRPGVNFLAEPSATAIEPIAARIRSDGAQGDVVVVSVHWGENWGYGVDHGDRAFALGPVESADVDIVHGYSSHHAKAIEVYRGKPILYGCGDFLNDYEGIENHEAYRGDLVLMYIVKFDAANRQLADLKMVPFPIRNFRLNFANIREANWLQQTMDRECRRFGGHVNPSDDAMLSLSWR